MKNNRYTLNTILEMEHVDLNRRWTPASMLTAMQTVADTHANQLGIGRGPMLEQGVYWVIARLRVEMTRYPMYLDKISLTTWPGQPERLTFPRHFLFEDQDGNSLGTATTTYMLLNCDTHQIVSPSQLNIYHDIEIFSQTGPSPRRINTRGSLTKTSHRTPVYSDIDLNHHMNNSRYAQWICDLFSTEQFGKGVLDTFQLNYVSDGLEGHRIEMCLFENENSFIVTGTDCQTDQLVFQATGSWKDEVSP